MLIRCLCFAKEQSGLTGLEIPCHFAGIAYQLMRTIVCQTDLPLKDESARCSLNFGCALHEPTGLEIGCPFKFLCAVVEDASCVKAKRPSQYEIRKMPKLLIRLLIVNDRLHSTSSEYISIREKQLPAAC